MRRALIPMILAALVAAALVVGASLGAGSGSPAPSYGTPIVVHDHARSHVHVATATTKASPLAALDKRFRALIPAARCAQGAAKATTAKRRRAAALKGARTA